MTDKIDHRIPGELRYIERGDLIETMRRLVLLMARKEMPTAYNNWSAEDYADLKRLSIALGADWGWL